MPSLWSSSSCFPQTDRESRVSRGALAGSEGRTFPLILMRSHVHINHQRSPRGKSQKRVGLTVTFRFDPVFIWSRALEAPRGYGRAEVHPAVATPSTLCATAGRNSVKSEYMVQSRWCGPIFLRTQ